MNDLSMNCSGNMRHLIVEVCIARNLLDTSAYLWLGYVNGRSNQQPRSVPSPMPGWSSLMKGSPQTPPMINVLVSTPASSQPPQFMNVFADHAASTLSSLFLSFALVINSFSHAVSPPSHPNHTSYSTTTHPTLLILLRISIIHIPTRPVSPSKLKCPSPPFSLYTTYSSSTPFSYQPTPPNITNLMHMDTTTHHTPI